MTSPVPTRVYARIGILVAVLAALFSIHAGNASAEPVTTIMSGPIIPAGGDDGDMGDIAEPYTWVCPLGCGMSGTAATQDDADSAEWIHLLSH